MRQLSVLLLSFVFLHGVCAVPLEERQLLGSLESFVTSVFNVDPTPTPADPKDSPSTPPSPPDPASDGNQDTTTLPGPAVRTSASSDSSSSEPTTSPSTSSSSSSASTTTTTSASSTTSASAVPTNPLTAAETPQSSTKNSGSSITPAGIAVAVIMSFAVLIAIFVVVWKFHPKVVAWRKRKAYERLQERTYRPALDGFLPQSSSNEKGLGLSNFEKTRPLSLFALAAPKHQIRRKPVPAAEYPVVEMPRLEKQLPARPPSYARAME